MHGTKNHYVGRGNGGHGHKIAMDVRLMCATQASDMLVQWAIGFLVHFGLVRFGLPLLTLAASVSPFFHLWNNWLDNNTLPSRIISVYVV